MMTRISNPRRSHTAAPDVRTSEAEAPGTLYVVATPIGNLSDITLRAVDVLRRCPVIAAEDTRRLRVLAERHGFQPGRVVRCDERTEERAALELLRALAAGESVALTADAGTPGISDPGYRVVRRVRQAGFRVVPVPGACAPVAALSASGLPSDRFLFAGFPPRRPEALRRFLRAHVARPETLLLLESPERAPALLEALDELVPGRELVLARELTKVHEELVGGSASELLALLRGREGRIRGEIVLLVAGARDAAEDGEGATAREERARALVARPWAAKLTRRDLGDLIATACGLERNAAYRLAGRLEVAAGAEAGDT